MGAKRKAGRPKVYETEAEKKAAHTKAVARYRKKSTITVSILLSRTKDEKLVTWLESHKPIARYLRGLVIRDMGNDKAKGE